MDKHESVRELKQRTQALLGGSLRHVHAAALAAALLPVGALVAYDANAVCIPTSLEKHATDGGFNLHNCGSPTSEGPEWQVGSGSNVSKTVFNFNPVTGKGGAALYVEQGGGQALLVDNQLYLMYDYFDPAPAFRNNFQNSFFDVFFEVAPLDKDYLVRMTLGGITEVLTKPHGEPSNENPDGTFDIGTPWTVASAADLQGANFEGAVRFDVSPNDTVNKHPIAEFELSINQTAFPTGSVSNPATGLYDPAPSFWSASVGSVNPTTGVTSDPPISCGVFTLHPDNTTVVDKPSCLDANGDPLLQPNAVPEPNSLALLGLGLFAFGGRLLRRLRR